jgi:hypothetical protein
MVVRKHHPHGTTFTALAAFGIGRFAYTGPFGVAGGGIFSYAARPAMTRKMHLLRFGGRGPGPEGLPERGPNTAERDYRHRTGAMRTSENTCSTHFGE